MRVVYMGTPDFAVPALNALTDAGFDVTDRISVTVQGDQEVTEAVKAYQDMIQKGVLAVEIVFGGAPEGAYAQDADVNGKAARLSVRRA